MLAYCKALVINKCTLIVIIIISIKIFWCNFSHRKFRIWRLDVTDFYLSILQVLSLLTVLVVVVLKLLYCLYYFCSCLFLMGITWTRAEIYSSLHAIINEKNYCVGPKLQCLNDDFSINFVIFVTCIPYSDWIEMCILITLVEIIKWHCKCTQLWTDFSWSS